MWVVVSIDSNAEDIESGQLKSTIDNILASSYETFKIQLNIVEDDVVIPAWLNEMDEFKVSYNTVMDYGDDTNIIPTLQVIPDLSDCLILAVDVWSEGLIEKHVEAREGNEDAVVFDGENISFIRNFASDEDVFASIEGVDGNAEDNLKEYFIDKGRTILTI